MASGPTVSWEIDGETVETVSDFIYLGSKITADGDCSHEIKRRLLLGRKVMTSLDNRLEKAMAPHSSTLAWKIPWMEGWWAVVHGVAKSRMRLSNFTFTFHFHALEKEMATHSSVRAWRIPGAAELVGCRLWGHTELDTTEAT